jgi:hypothetical protein
MVSEQVSNTGVQRTKGGAAGVAADTGASARDKLKFLVWKFLCTDLGQQAGLYVPADLYALADAANQGAGWRPFFFDLSSRRSMWQPAADQDEPPAAAAAAAAAQRFSVGVCARFRPAVRGAGGEAASAGEEVVLPLHQRVGLMQAELQCTKSAALQTLMAGASDPWAVAACATGLAGGGGGGGAAKGGAPCVNRSKCGGSSLTAAVLAVQPQQGKVLTVAPGAGLRGFEFDTVLGDGAPQADVYNNASTRRLVADVVNGFNATMLVYGQTGSGKTHTMFGPDPAVAGDDTQAQQQQGIVPRACTELLDAIDDRRRRHGIEAELRVSYVEVYGDDVNDLLDGGRPVSSNKAAAQRYVSEGRAGRAVRGPADVARLLAEGEAQKRVSETAMNARSSRAHTLFVLSLAQWRTEPAAWGTAAMAPGSARHASTLILADLGGSEQLRRSKADQGAVKMAGRGDADGPEYDVIRVTAADGTTRAARVFRDHGFIGGGEAGAAAAAGAEVPVLAQPTWQPESGRGGARWGEYYHQRRRLQEAQHINQGLFALKKCIDALNQQQQAPAGRKVFVPYSDSRLTQLLAAGLGGNSKTMVIVCGSLEKQNAGETLQALRFGERCRQVQNTASGSAAGLVAALAVLAVKIEQCEAQIEAKETCVQRQSRRPDADAPGGFEVVSTAVFAGAESERLQLVELVRQRKQLLGEDLDDEGEGANEWASRITADVVNVDRDAATYNIAALEGATMHI